MFDNLIKLNLDYISESLNNFTNSQIKIIKSGFDIEVI